MTDPRPQHDAAVSGMFGRIAGFYDLLNHTLSLGIDYYWRHVLAKNVRVGSTNRVLDLAAGTLDVSLAIRRKYPHVQVPAMDFCPPMLQRGLHKLKGDNARAIMPVAADAKKLPLPDASVDCVTMAFGIRNIKPRSEAFAEMLRVLTPGGRACILEFGSGSERIWGGLYNFYLDRILPRIGKMVSRDPGAYEYLAETIRNFPTAPALEKEMNALDLPGLRFRRTTFCPAFSKHQGKLCHGVQMHILDRERCDAFAGGLLLMDVIRRRYPEEFAFIRWSEEAPYAVDKLLGTDVYRTGAMTAEALIESSREPVRRFGQRAEKYLLY